MEADWSDLSQIPLREKELERLKNNLFALEHPNKKQKKTKTKKDAINASVIKHEPSAK